MFAFCQQWKYSSLYIPFMGGYRNFRIPFSIIPQQYSKGLLMVMFWWENSRRSAAFPLHRFGGWAKRHRLHKRIIGPAGFCLRKRLYDNSLPKLLTIRSDGISKPLNGIQGRFFHPEVTVNVSYNG